MVIVLAASLVIAGYGETGEDGDSVTSSHVCYFKTQWWLYKKNSYSVNIMKTDYFLTRNSQNLVVFFNLHVTHGVVATQSASMSRQ